MSSPAQHPHDLLFRSTFSQLEVVQEYLIHFLPSSLSSKINLDSLEMQKESFIDEELKEHYSDIVYHCQFGEQNIRMTFLLEHKSYQPTFPHLQLLQYMLNAYKVQINKEGFSGKLTPVVPVIVYHGEHPWKRREMSQYFEGMEEGLLSFVPSFDYLVTDLSQYRYEELADLESEWVKPVFLALKISRQRHAISQLVDLLGRLPLDPENELIFNFFRRILVYLFRTVRPKEDLMSAIKQSTQPEHPDGMSLYDYLLLQGEEKGIEKGIEKGRLLSQFNVFKKSYSKGLDFATIIEITGLTEELGKKWLMVLQENPKAEFPE